MRVVSQFIGLIFDNKEVQSWQSVLFVARAFISEIMSAIHIEDLIIFGSQTSIRLSVRLTEHLRDFMYVAAAFVQEQLREFNLSKSLRLLNPISFDIGFFHVSISKQD